MNKLFMIVITLFSITACSSLKPNSPFHPNGLESMVICKKAPSVLEVAHNIKKGIDFKASGKNSNFHVPTKNANGFGFKIRYVGLIGVGMFIGPNITVDGKFKEVKENILKKIDNKFECGVGGCGSKIDNRTQIMIYPHPTDKNLTIIQCGYFGP